MAKVFLGLFLAISNLLGISNKQSTTPVTTPTLVPLVSPITATPSLLPTPSSVPMPSAAAGVTSADSYQANSSCAALVHPQWYRIPRIMDANGRTVSFKEAALPGYGDTSGDPQFDSLKAFFLALQGKRTDVVRCFFDPAHQDLLSLFDLNKDFSRYTFDAWMSTEECQTSYCKPGSATSVRGWVVNDDLFKTHYVKFWMKQLDGAWKILSVSDPDGILRSASPAAAPAIAAESSAEYAFCRVAQQPDKVVYPKMCPGDKGCTAPVPFYTILRPGYIAEPTDAREYLAPFFAALRSGNTRTAHCFLDASTAAASAFNLNNDFSHYTFGVSAMSSNHVDTIFVKDRLSKSHYATLSLREIGGLWKILAVSDPDQILSTPTPATSIPYQTHS